MSCAELDIHADVALGDQVMLIHSNQIGDQIAHLCAMCTVLNCNAPQNTSHYISDFCHFLLFLLIVCLRKNA